MSRHSRAALYRLDDARNIVPCESLEEWARWFEAADRTVAADKVGALTVSTVFLGVPHYGPHGFDYYFETMIFGDAAAVEYVSTLTRERTTGVLATFLSLLTGTPIHEFQIRYRTWSEAVEGHARVVELCKQAVASLN